MAKDLIENQIIDYYDINNYLNKSKKNNDGNNCSNFEYKYKPMIYLFNLLILFFQNFQLFYEAKDKILIIAVLR